MIAQRSFRHGQADRVESSHVACWPLKGAIESTPTLSGNWLDLHLFGVDGCSSKNEQA
jgi:hypothetical protein